VCHLLIFFCILLWLMPRNVNISAIEQHVIDFVIDLRNEHDLTQDDIATIIGSKRTFITNIESGKNPAKYNLNHIDKLADHFGLSPKDFLPQIANKYV
jgi:transcriptional regulator with XRE-family HTH domain